MSDEEISNYIAQCAAEGLNLPEDIKSKALERIRAIDEKLAEADRLRPERATMVKIVSLFGGEIPRSTAKRVVPINDNLSSDELDEKTLQTVKGVCAYIEKHGSATPRELMDALEVAPENHSEIYSVIKWLYMKGIAIRNDKNKTVVRGVNWNQRPKQ